MAQVLVTSIGRQKVSGPWTMHRGWDEQGEFEDRVKIDGIGVLESLRTTLACMAWVEFGVPWFAPPVVFIAVTEPEEILDVG